MKKVQALGATVHYLPLRKVGFSNQFVALLRDGRYDVVHSHVHYSSGILLALARLGRNTPSELPIFAANRTEKETFCEDHSVGL
jgi:hypothetical protein